MSLEAAVHTDMHSGPTETHRDSQGTFNWKKISGNSAIQNVEDVNNTNHPTLAPIPI
jgi:hypothetical protein